MQTKQRLDVPLSLKSVSDSGEFEGYGSVFGVKDSHDDVVMSGAFAASLRAWSDRKALPALLWQHRMDEPIGVYTEMKEDDVGLYVRGRLLIDDDPLAKRAHAHMKAGSLTGLSIGYVLKDWEYDRSKEAFLLKEIDLWEVSLVARRFFLHQNAINFALPEGAKKTHSAQGKNERKECLLMLLLSRITLVESRQTDSIFESYISM